LNVGQGKKEKSGGPKENQPIKEEGTIGAILYIFNAPRMRKEAGKGGFGERVMRAEKKE